MKPKHLMTIYAVALLVYAGWRSFDYMTRLLADVSTTTANLVAIVFLFASEIGLLVWLYVAGPNATTEAQETTATVLMVVNFIGSMILGLADILAHNTLYAFEMPWAEPVLLLTPWVLVAANVAGHIVYHRSDADEKLKQAERALQFQERKLHILSKQAAIASLQAEQESMARELAPHYYRDIRDRVTGQTMRNLQRRVNTLDKTQVEGQAVRGPARDLPQPVVTGSNGRKLEPAESNPTRRASQSNQPGDA
jgi:hypothetical protein